METLFFELLQVALGQRESLSRNPSDQEWDDLYTTCQHQTVAGMVFPALDGLSKRGQKPPHIILFNWIALSEEIRQLNRVANQSAVNLCEELKQAGFECCILKGQGNALLYPNPMSRQPGDIDVWVKGHKDSTNLTDSVIRYVKEINPEGNAIYHHIDMGLFHGCKVEAHYRPSFMFNPIHNYRLQKWFKSHTESTETIELPEGVGCIRVPNQEFNIIFQLSHVYNHLLHEGIGIRQIIDYYFLLKSGNNTLIIEDGKWRIVLKNLGLEKIAGAMMWVLYEALGLDERFLIAPKDEKRGRVLLAEVMKDGNFGQNSVQVSRQFLKPKGRLAGNIQRFKRDTRLVRYFPSECIWEPFFRVRHFFWRLKWN